jgi:integrase
VKPWIMPQVTFHALRHNHISALIATNVDVVQNQPAHRHSSPAVTLRIYAHLFKSAEGTAAAAIEATLKLRYSREG